MNFYKLKHLGNQHPGQRTEHYSTPEAHLLLTFSLPHHTHTQISSMVWHRLIFSRFYRTELMQYVFLFLVYFVQHCF